MFRTGILAVFTAFVLSGTLGHAQGDPSLGLFSPAPDLNTLVVGQAITFSVQLSELEVSQELDSLAATVTYDGSLLSVPSISPGAIIPDPLDDALDFLTLEETGLADATFMTFGINQPDHIVADGAFFSFDVVALAAGSGSVSFDFVSATEFNPLDPFDPIPLLIGVGPALSFTVVSEAPEPATFSLLLMGSLSFLVYRTTRNCGSASRFDKTHTTQ